VADGRRTEKQFSWNFTFMERASKKR